MVAFYYVCYIALLFHALFSSPDVKMSIFAKNEPFIPVLRNFMEMASLRANKDNVTYFLIATAGFYCMMLWLMLTYEVALFKSFANLIKCRPNVVERKVSKPVSVHQMV